MRGGIVALLAYNTKVSANTERNGSLTSRTCITSALRALLVLLLVCSICACGDAQAEPSQPGVDVTDGASAVGGLFKSGPDEGKTDGPPYEHPSEVRLSQANITSDDASDWGVIDTSTASQGYVSVAVYSSERIKFQVLCNEMAYNYDVPGDGTVVTVPINMGDGWYMFRIMQNTSGDNYVEINAEGTDVYLENEFAPYLRPNQICNYTPDSQCVKKANELIGDAKNEGDVLQEISNYIIANVKYDYPKAENAPNVTGYIPDPDDTFTTNMGICFDYAVLGAAMLRSQGIPTRVMTGYVSPDNVYHSWIQVYINGSWHNVQFNVDSNTWTRMDLTFAAGGGSGFVGDGKSYTDRYTY